MSWTPRSNSMAHWTIQRPDLQWELLFAHHDLERPRSGELYRLMKDGTVLINQSLDPQSICVTSPSGWRALLVGHTELRGGLVRPRLRARYILDFESETEQPITLIADARPQWSHDETRLAYVQHTVEENGTPATSVLAIHALTGPVTTQRECSYLRCVRWRAGDRGLSAVVQRRSELHFVTFDVRDLSLTSELHLPLDSQVGDLSISPDGSYVAYWTAAPDQETGYIALLCRLSDTAVRPIGPVLPDAGLRWSPSGHAVAFRSDYPRAVKIFKPATEQLTAIASVDNGDESGENVTRDLDWSPDGRLIAFTTWERDGCAIRVVDLASGVVTTTVQTHGVIKFSRFIRSDRGNLKGR